MKASTERKIIRTIHIIGAGIIGTYIYSPWSTIEWFALLNQVFVVPLLILTGIWMWKGHKIRTVFQNNT